MVQPLISHKMLNAELSHNLAIPLLGIYPKEREKSHSWVYTQKKGKNPTPRYIPERNENICPHENLAGMFVAALFVRDKRCKLYCPPTDKWLNMMWCGHAAHPRTRAKHWRKQQHACTLKETNKGSYVV